MISVIIPAYNEARIIKHTIRRLKNSWGQSYEIIVVDGGSDDATVEESLKAGALVVHSAKKGRARQMNEGASAARGDIFYFIHADSWPPLSYVDDIEGAVAGGYHSGCYRLRFDISHWFLQVNAWFTRFNLNAFRFGDQSLFVTRRAFFDAGGFCEAHSVMEDQEIIARLRKQVKFLVMNKNIITSARRYLVNGVYKTQGMFYMIYFMYQLGAPQDQLVRLLARLRKA